jgi:hypothetical protein
MGANRDETGVLYDRPHYSKLMLNSKRRKNAEKLTPV